MNKIPNPRTRESIASRFRAGDSVAELAHDYELPAEAIEAAIREDREAAGRVDILNSNILALIELLTYDGVKYRGEGSVLVGEKLDEYRERTAKMNEFHRHEFSVLDVCQQIKGDACGSHEPASRDDIRRKVEWLRWRIFDAWDPPSLARFDEYDNAVRDIAILALAAWEAEQMRHAKALEAAGV
jgi:hypothetical protein